MNDHELMNELRIQYEHVSICLTGDSITINAKPLKRWRTLKIAEIKHGVLHIKDNQMIEHCKQALHSYWISDFKHDWS